MSRDVKVVHADPEGSCPCKEPTCQKVLIEWWRGPHDGLTAWICRKELVRKYQCRVLKIGKPGKCPCGRPKCRKVFVAAVDGPLPGARAWFCEQETKPLGGVGPLG